MRTTLATHASRTLAITIAISLFSSDASATDVESHARAIATADVRALVELQATGVDRFGDGDTIVRFGQTHRGLPVIGRGAAVRIFRSGKAPSRSVAFARDLPTSVEPSVDRNAAARLASRFSPIAAAPSDAHLVVWPTRDRRARLAWAVLPSVPSGVPHAPRVIVDAQTGEILEARDVRVFARVRSFLFNPLKTPTVSVYDLPLAPTGETLTNPFLAAANCVDRKTVKPVKMFGFDVKLHICDLENVAKADANGDFLYDPADEPGSADAKHDAFSEASIYYHASKAYAFFRTLQGDAEAQVVADKPLRVIANLQIPAGITSGNLQAAADPERPLEPLQNAFFSPAGGGLGALFRQLYGFSSGALWFGQGPERDYAYDGDVVYHEFGHAVVDASLGLGAWHVDEQGAIDAPGAMNEGLADYFSSAITGDADVGEYASKDLGAGASAIRTLANEDRCPNAVIGEVHYDSTLFSGALWQARSSLPEADRPRMDAALYKAMRANAGDGDVGFEDVAKMFLSTLATDLPSGAAALEAAMTARGVLPSCERVLDFDAGKAIRSPDERIGFVSPGRMAADVKGTAPGILQMRAKLPAKTSAVTVTFTSRAVRSPTAGVTFGGDATPFTPVVLAKLGKRITWSEDAKRGHDAELKAEATGSARRTAVLAIPEETAADTLYVQIANTGDEDGTYDHVEIAFETADTTAAPPAPDETPVAASEAGCGCATPGSSTAPTRAGVAGMFGAAFAFAAMARRRLRR